MQYQLTDGQEEVHQYRDKDIFILIEHQSRQDSQMPIKIIEYCMEIMRSVKNKEKMQKTIT